jgi:hypothetical protein
MTWNINLFRPTVIAETMLKEPFELLRNTLWQGSPLLIQPFHYPSRNHFESPANLETAPTVIQKDAHGHLTTNVAIICTQSCIITGVKRVHLGHG